MVMGAAVTPDGRPEVETMTSALAAFVRVTVRLADAPGATVNGLGETVNVSTDASEPASFVVPVVSAGASFDGRDPSPES
jgi:pseudouridine-5'-phosphate glycosidase